MEHTFLVSDTANDRIHKRIMKDTFEVFNIYDLQYVSEQGTSGTGDANYSYPRGIAISPDLRYAYVCDYFNHRIKKIDYDDLSYVWKAGSYGTGNGSFNYPQGLAISADGDWLIVTDTINDRIQKLRTTDLGYDSKIGSTGSGNDNFNHPCGCVISPDNIYIYITDTDNHRIVKRLLSDLSYVASAGVYGAGNQRYKHPSGITITSNGLYLFFCDSLNNRIVKLLASDLSQITTYGSYGSGNGQFDTPRGIALTHDDKYLIVTDRDNHRIQKIDAENLTYVSKIGSSGSGNNNFSFPQFCDIDKNGYILITDSSNHRVKKHQLLFEYEDLTYQDEACTNGSGDDNLDTPLGIAVSEDDRYVAIADSANGRLMLRYLDDLTYYTEKIVPVANCAFTPDNLYLIISDGYATTGKIIKYDIATLSVQATSTTNFDEAQGIAVTPDGVHVLIADTGNDKIVRLLVSDLSFVDQIGSTGSGNNQYSGPKGIAVHPDSEYFLVADTGNDRVVKCTLSTLAYDSEAGTTGTGDDNLSGPCAIAIEAEGLFFLVADTGNDRIKKYQFSDMSYISEIGSNGASDDNFDTPSGICFVPLGVTRVETITEPATDYFYDKLVKYLPDFVTINDIITAILKGFQAALLTAKKWINASTTYALKNYKWQGAPLLQMANERHIFLSSNETDRQVQYYVENALEIHERRGTKVGLRQDLIRMTEDDTLTISEVDKRQSGWWLDVSYPTIDDDFNPDVDSTASFLNCIDQIQITLLDSNKKYSTTKLKEIIDKYLVPGHITAHVKTEANLIWYIAVNDDGDDMDLSKIHIY